MERTFDDQGPGLDRFGLTLVLTVVSVVGLALVDVSGTEYDQSQDVGALISAVVVGLTLVVALRASGLRRRRQRTVDLLVGLVVLGYGVSLFGSRTPQGSAGAGVSVVLVLLSVVAPVVVVLRLLRHREVTLATILGAISAYLLIAVAYFYVFLTLYKFQDRFFAEPQPSSSYMYFSLTSITTVGYGDLTAVTRVGRLMANSEAVIGQVYLVTFVAFIVSLGATAWRSRRDQESASAADEQP
ncbi:MAG TPA: potassium channel family protein [Candidatus Nanopelagicales bacterium]|nr:potassium channel family protein [Candidatus Nanopelagicales bacterium]